MTSIPFILADGGATARQVLDTAGEIAGVILVLELTVAVALLAALMIALWFAVRWVRFNLTPLLDLYGALRPIDAITGATTADDILNRIFSTFCIGK